MNSEQVSLESGGKRTSSVNDVDGRRRGDQFKVIRAGPTGRGGGNHRGAGLSPRAPVLGGVWSSTVFKDKHHAERKPGPPLGCVCPGAARGGHRGFLSSVRPERKGRLGDCLRPQWGLLIQHHQ